MPDFNEQIEALAKRSATAERHALTEEATKTSVVLPFIQALGFDVFNLDEVTPEFIADVGTKKGEKVDFALRIDGKVAMLVEAKPIGTKLGEAHLTQLFRYFSVTEGRLAILTNGREAWFYSDTDAPNKMDRKPFFTFDFQQYDKGQLKELERFHKSKFEIDAIIEAASNLKFTRAAATYIKRQLDDPDDEFVRLIGKQIYDGKFTASVAEQIKPSIQAALDEVIRDRIQDRLGVTFGQDTQSGKAEQVAAVEAETDDSGVVTTDEEMQAYMIVRAIGAKSVPLERIAMRDAKSYCAVLMDDNNRKPICRFYFNSATTKAVGIFDAEKNEVRHKIESIREIYDHAAEIEAVIASYT